LKNTASWAYLKKDAPRYIPGTILNIVATAAVPLLALGTVLYIRWENKIRDAGGRDHRLDGLTQEEILDLGSRHPEYVDSFARLYLILIDFESFRYLE
jgi:hypothetical protein